MLSHTLRLNFCYLKIIRILRPYRPKIIGHIVKIIERIGVSVFLRYTINHNENEDDNEK